MYHGTRDLQTRHELAAAGVANLIAWLAMLRGGELFGLELDSIEVISPARGPEWGLPAGVGFIDLRLRPETKSSPHKVADVVASYKSFSGLSLGKWMDRLLTFTPSDGTHLFSTPAKAQWDSNYFRSNYAWPLLELQRLSGEPTLKAFTDVEGSRIRDKVWSMHSWRRGFTSNVKRKRPHNYRAATADELDLQARWRRALANNTMQQRYDGDADLGSRLALTMLCC